MPAHEVHQQQLIDHANLATFGIGTFALYANAVSGYVAPKEAPAEKEPLWVSQG